MRKESGSIGEYMATGICMLFLTVLVIAFLDNVSMIGAKQQVNQIARKYILRMETMGGLQESDRLELMKELEGAGLTDISLEGSSMGQNGYGKAIVLQVRGRLGGGYEIFEKRVSTAKN